MNAPVRRGACPALSAPMQTGDGLLVRLNPIAAGFSPAILVGLCESALRHGNGIVEVTARGSVQIRGLTVTSAAKLAVEVDRLGITVRTGVPVETGPLAGLDAQEIIDPRPLAQAIRAAIRQAGLSAALGPKVSVVVDGGGHIDLSGIAADVRLVAGRAGGESRWYLAIGGDAATARPLGFLDETEASAAALAVLEAIAELGREARARDLAPDRIKGILERTKNCSTPPPSDATRREPSHVGNRPIAPSAVGTVSLEDGSHALGIALPFGSMPANDLIALTRRAEILGIAEIRPAPPRTLLFVGLPTDACGTLRETAAELGFITDPTDARLSIAACPGKPACASGRLATRAVASGLAAAVPEFFDGSFLLHVSGCAKGCAHPGTAALTIAGGESGTALVVAGTARSAAASTIDGRQALAGLGRIASTVRLARRPGETTAACLARLGASEIATAFGRK